VGLIVNPERMKQIIDFSGLPCGMSDIDGLVEWKDKGYIFVEIKTNKTPLPFGQKLALERLVKDTGQHKKSIAIIASHNVYDSKMRVIAAECIVRNIYSSEDLQWRDVHGICLKNCIAWFISQI